MTSFRPAGDKAWNYVREEDKLKPYLRWVPRGPNLFECTVTDGWKAKVMSNCPDGSYATKDLFEPHPTIPHAWKYIARLDDTLVLVNGEKFNPVMMEGKIRSHKAVTETVVFGAGRPYLGLLVVPSDTNASTEEVVDRIYPVVEELNRTSEAYARISRDMVKVLPHNCDFPRTDKGSIIRQAFYSKFREVIDDAYDQSAIANGDLKALSVPELETFIRGVLTTLMPDAKDVSVDDDFFALGVDSLQSLLMRTEILKNIDIGGNQLGQNVVFENSSIAALSAYLYGLRSGTGRTAKQTPIEADMQSLIEKYGTFSQESDNYSVAVTGTTGSLGAHVLAQLAVREDISTIYAFARAQDSQNALRRVRSSLIKRRLYHILPLTARRKIVALPVDLSHPRLNLTPETYDKVTSKLRSVIHCAWSVNFNINLASFEKDCIAGIRHLLDLCHAVPSPRRPASFDFCSSVSAVARCPSLHTPETLPAFEWAQSMGYAQSKLVAEHICTRAAESTGLKTRVLRVGQIVADTVHGIWNPTEGIPLMLQTALTTGALPQLQESPSWTPVDVVARAVADIALSDAGPLIANVTNPHTFDWISDLLPALRSAGLVFEEVTPKEWVRRLRHSNPDPVLNPPIKLVDFFASKYDRDSFAPARTYATEIACKHSPALRNAPVLDPAFVGKFVSEFQRRGWRSSQVADETPKTKRAIILTGPRQSTIGRALSEKLECAFIDGDTLHTSAAVARMRDNVALLDVERVAWLQRVQNRVLETTGELGFDTVAVACEARKRVDREQLRGMSEGGVEVWFVELQVEEEGLEGKQVEGYEGLGVEETDVWPVDAEGGVGDVVGEVEWLLEEVGK